MLTVAPAFAATEIGLDSDTSLSEAERKDPLS